MSPKEISCRKDDIFELFAILRGMLKEDANFYIRTSSAKKMVMKAHSIVYPYIFYKFDDDCNFSHEIHKKSVIVAESFLEKVEFNFNEIHEVLVNDSVSKLLRGKVSRKFKYFQRRLSPRVYLPISEGFKIKMEFRNKELEDMIIYDLSIGGVGVYSYQKLPVGFNVGAIVSKARLDFGIYGEIVVDIKVLVINDGDNITENDKVVRNQISMNFINSSIKTNRTISKFVYMFLAQLNKKR